MSRQKTLVFVTLFDSTGTIMLATFCVDFASQPVTPEGGRFAIEYLRGIVKLHDTQFTARKGPPITKLTVWLDAPHGTSLEDHYRMAYGTLNECAIVSDLVPFSALLRPNSRVRTT